MSILASDKRVTASLTAAWNGSGTEPSNTTCTVEQPSNGTVAFQITSIPTATITWEATVDGTTYETVSALKLSTKAFATTATATGIYFVSVPGAMRIRGRCSAFTSGPVVMVGAGTVASLQTAALSGVSPGTVNQGTGAAATGPWAVRLSDGTVFTDTVAFANANATQATAITSAERVVADVEILSAGDNVMNRVRSAKDMVPGVGGGSMVGAAMGVYDSTGALFKPAKGFADGTLLSGGFTTIITTTLTRPADTTAYTAGDEMTDTGGAIQTITGAARFSGGTGSIKGVYVSQSTLWTTKPAMELWVYDTTSTPVADNGAFAPTDGVTDTCIGVIPVTATYAGTVNQALDSGPIDIPYLTVGSANLFFRVVIRNAAQDSANSGVTKFRWRLQQD